MIPGGGKRKGGAFEREICKALSLWVTGGRRADVFWRSAMSGGRATLYQDVQQCGDITAVAPEGFPLVDYFYCECKAYRDLQVGSWVVTGKGRLADFWGETSDQAAIHNRHPLLIFRQNNWPVMMVVSYDGRLWTPPPRAVVSHRKGDATICDFKGWLALKYKDQPWLR